MIGFSANLRYYLYSHSTDMRNGFDGLSGIVRNKLGKDPLSGDVFIFINKQRTHIKLLFWDGDGFGLFYKRLEKGRYRSLFSNSDYKLVNRQELLMLLEGLSFKELSRSKRYKK